MKSLQRYIDQEASAQTPTEQDRLINELLERKRSGKFLRWEDFSFDISQERTRHITGNLSDLVIEERRES